MQRGRFIEAKRHDQIIDRKARPQSAPKLIKLPKVETAADGWIDFQLACTYNGVARGAMRLLIISILVLCMCFLEFN